MGTKRDLLADDNVWAAMVAHRFARHPAINLPPGNLWEPGIARSLAKAVKEGRHSRDGVEMLMALQLGIAEQRSTTEHEQQRRNEG